MSAVMSVSSGANDKPKGDGIPSRPTFSVEAINQFAAEMDAFSRCVLQNKPVSTSGEMGLQDRGIVPAVIESPPFRGVPVRIKSRCRYATPIDRILCEKHERRYCPSCGCGASKFLRRADSILEMSVQVYGCNHVAIEVGDVEEAVAFYRDVFALEKLDEGEGDAFFKLGEHQFLAMFENKGARRENGSGHFGIMVRDEAQLAEVRQKLVKKYRLKLIPGFRCDFRDPWGNRIQVVDLHDESLIWLLPYREVQKAGVKFGEEH